MRRRHTLRSRRDHPHSRGENDAAAERAWVPVGSSPLTRGKHLADRVHELTHGLIPTHAGKTWCASARPQRSRAHPRSCGENRCILVDQWSRWGSSPLMRGKHRACDHFIGALRLIPAHAGKTMTSARASFACRAHPRSCGENSGKLRYSKVVEGSSPLTRGKRYTDSSAFSIVRLIPTHAGKIWRFGSSPGSATAHPHSRGENYRVMTEPPP